MLGVSIYIGPMWLLITLQIIMLCIFLNFKIIYDENYQSSITLPGTREENIFCITTYLETNSFKTVQSTFLRMFNFNNYPQESHIYLWEHQFQATWSVNNPNKKVEKSKIRFQITCYFICIVAKNLKGGSSAVNIKKLDQDLIPARFWVSCPSNKPISY